MNYDVRSVLDSLDFSIYGFCRFCDVLPLLNVKSRQRIPDNAKSIITFLFPYKVNCNQKRNLSLYCIGKDYHNIISNKLNKACESLKATFPQNNFEAFCDISPINEVKAAYLSGLGVLGKNGLIINKKYGSYCFIGEIVTDLELYEYSVPLGFCIGCNKCQNSCISGALKDVKGKTFTLDLNLCVSAITQKKGELSQNEVSLVKKGGLVWGCDVCSDVCPMNKAAEQTNIKEFYSDLLFNLTEQNLNGISDRAYFYKGKNTLLRNLGIINPKADKNNIK